MSKFIPLFFLFFIVSSCTTTSSNNEVDEQTGDNPNVKFTIVAQGVHSNISLVKQLVIKTDKEWQKLLKIHGGENATSLANINFSDNVVVAIFAGQQPSGGYSVGISNIKHVNDNLFISVTFKQPKQGDPVTLALTQPYIFLATEKVDGRIVFLANDLN